MQTLIPTRSPYINLVSVIVQFVFHLFIIGVISLYKPHVEMDTQA